MLSWRDIEPQRVTQQSIDAVMNFLKEYEKKNKKGYITIRLLDLAEKVKLATGTLNKALSDLNDNGIIEIIKNKGNNIPKTYIFKKDISKYEPMISTSENTAAKQAKEMRRLRQKVEIYEDFLERVKSAEHYEDEVVLRVEKAPDGSAGIPIYGQMPPKRGITFKPKDYEVYDH